MKIFGKVYLWARAGLQMILSTEPPHPRASALPPAASLAQVGVASGARIGGIRILDGGGIYDATEAAALSWNRSHVDVYSCSWGCGNFDIIYLAILSRILPLYLHAICTSSAPCNMLYKCPC